MDRLHYTAQYLITPTHPVTVNLVGCGGTGSSVLTCLARMDVALRGLGHPGFHLTAWDPDNVSESNVGRQMFSPSEIGANKAAVAITRVNRFFGLKWLSEPQSLRWGSTCNITVSCVDSATARVSIGSIIKGTGTNTQPYNTCLYWLDFGNSQATGQVVLGTIRKIQQPSADAVGKLPCVTEMFDLQKPAAQLHDDGPSCSLAQALGRQDLFVNSTLAQLGVGILWKMFRELSVRHRGLYMNLNTMRVNPIPV